MPHTTITHIRIALAGPISSALTHNLLDLLIANTRGACSILQTMQPTTHRCALLIAVRIKIPTQFERADTVYIASWSCVSCG